MFIPLAVLVTFAWDASAQMVAIHGWIDAYYAWNNQHPEPRRNFFFGRRHEPIGASDGIRTRDQELGKLLLYQLSYARPAVGAGIVTHCSVKYSVKRRTKAPDGPVM